MTRESDNFIAKHIHKIVINEEKADATQYIYNFGHTKNIKIEVANGSICISAKLTKQYDKQEMLYEGAYLFPDALKKALLIHLILFSENIEIETVAVQIDDDYEIIGNTRNDGYNAPIESMVIGKLVHPFSVAWDSASIEGILAQTKSSYDSRSAALFALICSKSKRYETERFIYLWMAFNGMYSYFSKLISNEHEGKNIKLEWQKIRYLQRLFEIGDETFPDNKEKRRIAQDVISLIKKNKCKITHEFIKSKEGESFLQSVQKLLVNEKEKREYNISVYGYLLTQLSYYFRCNLIHADRPVALFSFRDDGDICCLRAINDLLDEFIEDNIHLWFNSNYVKAYLIPKARAMEIIK